MFRLKTKDDEEVDVSGWNRHCEPPRYQAAVFAELFNEILFRSRVDLELRPVIGEKWAVHEKTRGAGARVLRGCPLAGIPETLPGVIEPTLHQAEAGADQRRARVFDAFLRARFSGSTRIAPLMRARRSSNRSSISVILR